jgi:hypothetical protein
VKLSPNSQFSRGEEEEEATGRKNDPTYQYIFCHFFTDAQN